LSDGTAAGTVNRSSLGRNLVPTLTVLAGPDAGRQFDLAGPTISVGRHSGNSVHLHDDRVSRRHLELRSAHGGYQLFDLDSGNGTQVNGRTVQVIDLHPGDRIGVGDSLLRYDSEPPSVLASARLVVRATPDHPSNILRSVAAEAGGRLLARPDQAATDWLRTRLASLAVLYETTTAVSTILDVDELLGRIVDLVLRTTDADHGCALLTDPETGELLPRAVRSRGGPPGGEFVVSRTVADHVLRAKEGVLVADAGADERFRSGESVARLQIRDVICVPMTGRRDTVGVLFLSGVGDPGAPHRESRFTEDHLTLAVAIAHQAALAVEETRYYQAMLQAERLAAVGQTIAALSHHIKNIMQGVRFGSDMVRTGLSGDQELLEKGWKLVEKNQSRIDDLILDMLSYSKDREPAVEPTNLNALITDVLEVVRGRAAEAGVALEFAPAEGLPQVSCDPEGIHRALLNVVSNALDAVADVDNPRVSVTAVAAGPFAEVCVSDNGSGIPAEKLADVFRPFVSTKGSRGTGLGLPVSRKTLREHGGDVVAENLPGGGCRFALRIPLTPPRAKPATAAE